MDFIDLEKATFDASALDLVSVIAATAYRVVPLYVEDELIVAMDRENDRTLDDLHLLTGLPVRGLLATSEAIDRVLETWACEFDWLE